MPKMRRTTALLLEDQPLIALEVEDMLRRAGFDDVIILAACAPAMQWLEANLPALAVIETRLRDGPSSIVATALSDRGVPTIVHSGDTEELDPLGFDPISKRIWVGKPCSSEVFLKAVADCRASV